jgi:hypothetical protein
MDINYASQITKNLKAKGESNDFIIGFLQATLDQCKYLSFQPGEFEKYLERTIKQTQPDYQPL